MLRYPRVGLAPGEDPTPTVVAAANPFVLTDLATDELVFEFDWVEGCEPREKAIRRLERRAREQGPPGKRVRIERSDEIPRVEWEAIVDDDYSSLIERYADRTGPEVVHVLYAPSSKTGELTGFATTWTFRRGDDWHHVAGMVIFRETIDSAAVLWITGPKIERSTLVHEYGHVLGLSVNPEHTQKNNPMHCANPQCVMPHPRLRSILYHAIPAFFLGRMPTNYCRACRRDLHVARETFHARRDDPAVQARLEAPHDVGGAVAAAQRMADDDPDAAKAQIRRAERMQPDAEGWLRIARAHRQFGEDDASLAAFDRSVERGRLAGRADIAGVAHAGAARLLGSLGRWDDAIVRIDAARVLGQSDWILKPVALECAGRIDEALAAWGEAAHVLPVGAQEFAAVGRAGVLRRLGRTDEAASTLAAVDAPSPSLAPALWYEVGRTRDAHGNVAGARAAYRRAADAGLRLLDADLPADALEFWAWNRGMAASAIALARLGLEQDARERVESVRALEKLRASVVVAELLGDRDGAIAALDEVGSATELWWDWTVDEDLGGLRADRRTADRFAACPGGKAPQGP